MLNLLIPGLIACFTLLVGCQPAKPSPTEPDVSAATTAAQPAAAENELPFPVYDNFDELAPIFERRNDTTYVINFWATWCKPCIAEMPYFEELHTKMAGEKMKVILVSLDFPKDVDTKLLSFVKERQLQPQVIALTDTKYNEWIDRVSPEWGGAIPVTFIYRNDDKLFHDGSYANYAELEQSVRKILP